MGRGNERGDQEDTEIDNNKRGDRRDQKTGKVGCDGVGDGVGVGKFPKDVEVGNNSMCDSARNQDNWYPIVKDVENSDDRVTIVVDLAAVDLAVVDSTDGVIANVSAYLFGFLLP